VLPLNHDGHSRRVGAEANQLGIGTCSRREALRAYVHRFEQVGLTRSIRADDQDEAGLQLELEALVGPEVAQSEATNV